MSQETSIYWFHRCKPWRMSWTFLWTLTALHLHQHWLKGNKSRNIYFHNLEVTWALKNNCNHFASAYVKDANCVSQSRKEWIWKHFGTCCLLHFATPFFFLLSFPSKLTILFFLIWHCGISCLQPRTLLPGYSSSSSFLIKKWKGVRRGGWVGKGTRPRLFLFIQQVMCPTRIRFSNRSTGACLRN